MKELSLQSPAKVNLHLQVIAKRPDGYHDLRMLMVGISIYDEVKVTLTKESISLYCDHPGVPLGDKNIALRAARLFVEETGFSGGIDIQIKKKIPMGGGLGGGSSNAASVLMALNELTGNRLSKKKLLETGLKLGADVPFFIFKGAALAEGIGEKLTQINDLPEMWFLLVNPGIEVPTASIFKSINLELTKERENHNITGFNYSLESVISVLHNDLESVTLKKHPEVAEALALLRDEGSAEGVLMSGSGATVFGLYDSEGSARKALVQLEKDIVCRGWAAFVAHSL
ncbi:MAG: 4-(cytidine 5'-diphospho)-2-C-methyl-D-erythritol kinase [Proteobacteria bacterium]|nr:4-(cytidine 5'-diphospho)-2-C-methyl-D-erythritol kinase [Pseudomonadota bacterium]